MVDRSLPSAPLVLVTAPTAYHDNADWLRLRCSYLNALTRVGLLPVTVAPLPDLSTARPLLARMAGLVLTGGEDVAPDRYGALPHPRLGPTSPERDAWEVALIHAAAEMRCPTLAICRGIQILNVALEGTLIQDLSTERPSDLDHRPNVARETRTHAVSLDPTSRLAHVTGTSSVRVNSIHHQAIDRVASALWVTGSASDGVIESVESRDEAWWMIGVQWHPEELDRDAEPWDRNLFAAFADAVRKAEQDAALG